ncbi:MAG: DUF4080 domain-containing protein [Kofleriaceae bacterium]|nr:DUF4080 domain-containing protein [Kofleriaceae bacterium]
MPGAAPIPAPPAASADVVLATLNAKYIHSAVGLRCLRANLGPARGRSIILEATIADRPIDVVERILAARPRLVGLGVYVWNATASLAVVRLLKQLAPDVVVVIGGPEVSHELEAQPIVAAADHVITGEGEVALARVVATVLRGGRPLTKVIAGGSPDLATLALPWDEYTDADVAHRVIYVEAARGCPFACEFCLSSLDDKVRSFPIDAVLAGLDRLIARGARQFKFVDRTFNLAPRTSHAILDFFLARQALGVFAHFEMIPDRFPDGLRARIAGFRPGAIQLEVGVQTLDAEVAERVSRRLDVDATAANLRWLADHTGAHVHADLIIGLPGEDAASFGRGFDQLLAMGPHEIQVGVLKRLRGTPIGRHDDAFAQVWSPDPPYELVASRVLPLAELQRLKRFARLWDLVANRGYFPTALPALWAGRSPFATMLAFTDFVAADPGAHLGAIALPRLAELLVRFAHEVQGRPLAEYAPRVAADLAGPGRSVPALLAPYVTAAQRDRRAAAGLPPRQARHHREG